MRTISRADIPADYTYYRTHSQAFFTYVRGFLGTYCQQIAGTYQFFRIDRFLPFLPIVSYEKVDTEPDIAHIKSLGIAHGIVTWAPMRRIDIPAGYMRLPTFLARHIVHSSRSGMCILDTPEYYNKWLPTARAHRRKVHTHIATGDIRIEVCMDIEYFMSVYTATQVPDPEKPYRISLCKKIYARTPQCVRMYLVYIHGVPLAGGVFIDMDTTTEYFTSFYHVQSKPYHAGIALLDRWMADSYIAGYKYADLDHMRDAGQSAGYAGYTRFKESIVDYDVYFHDMYLRVF